MDRLYLQNRLLSMIGEQELGEVDIRPVATPAADLAEQLCQVASANQLVKQSNKRTVHGAIDGFVNTATFCG